MEEPNKAHQDDEKNPIVAFFLNLIGAIKVHFPKKIKDNNGDDKGELAEPIVIKQPAVVVVEDESNKASAAVVTFPKQSLVPLKLETEAEDSERTTNPLLLWQVYAIGGFFVMRWAWTKWNERKGQKKPDDEPPPSQD